MKIRKGSLVRACYRTLHAEHRLFDTPVVPAFWQWPGYPGRRHFLQVVMDRTLTDRTSSGDLPLPQPQLEAEAEDFLDLAHGQSPGWHAVSPVNGRNSLPSLISSATPLLWKTFRAIMIARNHRSPLPGIRSNEPTGQGLTHQVVSN